METQVIRLTAELITVNLIRENAMLKKAKVYNPQNFNSSTNGNRIKNLIAAFENFFNLMEVTDYNQRARYAKIHIVEKASIWF